MRMPFLALALVLVAANPPACAQTSSNVAPLTLAEVLRQAETTHPLVRSREAQLAAAEGSRREAAAGLFNNPELSFEQTRRRAQATDGRAQEWRAGLAQPFEVGGQQARRREAAAASLDALRAEIEDARRQVRADASPRFHAVLAAQRRVEIEQRSVELFEGTAQAVAKRKAAGEDTRLDANVALIEAERARNVLEQARERLLGREQLLSQPHDTGHSLPLPRLFERDRVAEHIGQHHRNTRGATEGPAGRCEARGRSVPRSHK